MRAVPLVRTTILLAVLAGSFNCIGADSGSSEDQAADGAAVGAPADGRGVRGGVVAVSHPLAAKAGADVLRAGGNAIDAAAAIQFALNVVEPQYSGIGGGGFMMIHLARSNRTIFVDSRETAPAAATPDQFVGMEFTPASTSGIAVGVPGTLKGVSTALRNYGTISLAQALQPAIRLARDGFPVGSILARDIAATDRIDNYPGARELFKPGGVPLAQGTLLRQPDLARTFDLIASRGVNAFYRGEIANAIVAAQRQTRPDLPAGVGRMSLADLANYDVEIRTPVEGRYRGFTFKSMPSPSSGGLTIIQMLEMLEQFPLGRPRSGFTFGAVPTLNVMVEAMRLGFADRAVWMGDDDFVPVPDIGLIAPRYLATRAPLIHADSRNATVLPGDPRPYDPRFRDPRGTPRALEPNPEGVHTTHFSVVDRWGNVVTYTSTIEAVFGTGIMVPGYGFMLNNELTDFNMTPTANSNPATFNPGANDVAPGKRPRSSMAPSMLFLGSRLVAAYGSPGGGSIINTVLGITLNVIDHRMTMQQAIDAPRISRASASDTAAVSYEAGFPEASLQGLRDLGHTLAASPAAFGSVQAVMIDPQTGRFSGAADSRREGTVISLELGDVDLAAVPSAAPPIEARVAN